MSDSTKRVIVTVEGGVVQNVSVPPGVEVEVRDYDVEQMDDAHRMVVVKEDDKGDRYIEAIHVSGEVQPHKPQDVWIRWGSAGNKMKPSHYQFDTNEEMNAFLKGVDAAVGWMDHEQFDQDPATKTDDHEDLRRHDALGLND